MGVDQDEKELRKRGGGEREEEVEERRGRKRRRCVDNQHGREREGGNTFSSLKPWCEEPGEKL